MPPLRDRIEDILLLSNLFIEENNRSIIKAFEVSVRKLRNYWPNITGQGM
jgi:transcriptional regulator with GAF, ATPase, and Fis domain